jgi:hypothetical protein
VNDAERCLNVLLGELEKPAYDAARAEQLCRKLATSLAKLSPDTPRIDLERVVALHATLRVVVERRREEVGRDLRAVLRALESISRLTRPRDKRNVVDVDA